MEPDNTMVGPRVEEIGAKKPRVVVHVVLFLLTYASTTIAGAAYLGTAAVTSNDIFTAYIQVLTANLPGALLFSTLLMIFLTAHEFGHYFAARAHGVGATLPYYIPLPLLSPFGTMGAVIRLRSPIPTRAALFDIGVAGPLAGFVVALAYLVIGIVTMPGIEALYQFHPDYRGLAALPTRGEHFGDFLLFVGLRELLVAPGQFFPPLNEIYHFPFLAVGWFGMFVTALNMIPAGQLDGGHIAYAMFGFRQRVIARWVFRALLFIGLGSVASLLLDATRTYQPDALYQFFQRLLGPPMEIVASIMPWWLDGFGGWLFWAFLVRYFFRLEHPPLHDPAPLDARRRAIGWFSFVMLVLVFSFAGLYER